MRILKSIGTLLLLVIALISCESQKEKDNEIVGLWKVTKVAMGPNAMTPIERWVQFNADSTQVSGNGWVQHSIGTWSLNAENSLRIFNANGLKDELPFTAKVNGDTMTWEREESGENLKVSLVKIDKIPTSDADRLLGLWKLDSVSGPLKAELESNLKSLFIRWDRVFEKQLADGKKIVGVYKTHGHRNELQLVNYGDNPEFEFHKFQVTENKLTTEIIGKDSKLFFSRIDEFIR